MQFGKFGTKPAAAPPPAAPAASGFKRQGFSAAPAPAAAPPAAGAPRRRLMNFGSGTERLPMLPEGFQGVVMWEGATYEPSPKDKRNAWIHVTVVTDDGRKWRVLFCATTDAGASEFTRAFRTTAGYETDEDMVAALGDPERFLDFGEAACGMAANEFSAGGNPLAGRLVSTSVTRGGDTPNGDYYRDYQWQVVPEDQQPQAAQ